MTDQPPAATAETVEDDLPEQMRVRREKRQRMVESGRPPYPGVVRLYLQENRAPAVGARKPIVELARVISRYAIEITQKGRVVDPDTARGPIRLRLR